MSDKISTYLVTCEGGLDNKNSPLQVAQATPGAARRLLNFEPSIRGGYRRINGYQPLNASYEEVDSAAAEGPVLGVFIFDDEIYAARKQQSGTTYKIYKYDSGSGWVAQSPGFALNTTDGTYTVTRVSYDVFSFEGTNTVIFADGVNNPYMYNGSSWVQIDSTATGANFANAGGANALDKAAYVEVYNGHVFLSGDPTAPGVVAHSTPQKEYDWLTANGSGQLYTGFAVNAIKVWRDFMYCFGVEDIGYVGVSGTDFVFKNVSTEIGCVAPQSVVEIDGNLMYLSQDGFRTIAGTDKINDIDIGTISRKIRQLINTLNGLYTTTNVVAVAVPNKSQVRFIWNLSTEPTASTRGVIGGLRERIDGSQTWEWGELEGIQSWVSTTDRISGTQYVLHGDYAGNVYRQEQGSSFNGSGITATYTTPFFHFGEPMIRKQIRDIHIWAVAEGSVEVSVETAFDWEDPNKLTPSATSIVDTAYAVSMYGDGSQYGDGSTYGGGIYPLFESGLVGTCRSAQFSFTTTGTENSYTIQEIAFEYTPEGRR